MKFSLSSSRATRDFDFVLDVLSLREVDVDLADKLKSLDYVPVPEAKLFQFEKAIPGTLEKMRIEFMAPDAYRRKQDFRVDVQKGIHARACTGGSIVLSQSDFHEITGRLPDGHTAKTMVRVTRPHALVMQKLLAMDDRYRNVRGSSNSELERDQARTHLSDVAAIVKAQTDLAEFRKQFQNQFESETELGKRTFEIIRTYFRDRRSPGLVLFEEYIHLTLEETDTDILSSELDQVQGLLWSLQANAP